VFDGVRGAVVTNNRVNNKRLTHYEVTNKGVVRDGVCGGVVTNKRVTHNKVTDT